MVYTNIYVLSTYSFTSHRQRIDSGNIDSTLLSQAMMGEPMIRGISVTLHRINKLATTINSMCHMASVRYLYLFVGYPFILICCIDSTSIMYHQPIPQLRWGTFHSIRSISTIVYPINKYKFSHQHQITINNNTNPLHTPHTRSYYNNYSVPYPQSNRGPYNPADWHATTILTVRKGGDVVVIGDGQVSLGQQVIKGMLIHLCYSTYIYI